MRSEVVQGTIGRRRHVRRVLERMLRPKKERGAMFKIARFAYARGPIPPGYKCAGCGDHGVKLWREYNTMACYITLRCAACAVANQAGEIGPNTVIGDDGKCEAKHGYRTDQIGYLMPAVPTEDGETFWGYTSVPQPGVDWWKRLPTRRKKYSDPREALVQLIRGE